MTVGGKYFSFLLILSLPASGLHAQDTSARPAWSLEKCISYAIANNVQIGTLRLERLVSQQAYQLAKASRLPSLSATESQTFVHANGDNTTGYRGGSSTSGSYGLSSSVTLYNGNVINNTIRQTDLAVQSAGLTIDQEENNLTLQVTQAYLAILLDKENIIYDSTVVSTAQAQLKREQQLYDAGSVARSALIQLQAQLATDQFTLVNAHNIERADLLTLKQLLLLSNETAFDVQKPDTVIAAAAVRPFRESEQNALNNFPDVKIGQLGVHIANYGVAIARAGYRPALTAGASVNSDYNSYGGGFGSQLNNNFNQQIALTLAVPVFTKRTVKTKVEEAKIQVEQSQLNLKNTTLLLSQSVERAYINALNAQGQYGAAFNQYRYNQESYRVASAQLKVGTANIVDFLLQKTLFLQAQQAFIQAKYNALLTLKVYDFYSGVPIKL
ncbi:TolC family protein [Mucilaginibacter sp. UR6-11]|uniref:TolC family protein n=1 Tax=Mucilaginibacter sp. UR6-11 TaxID=1435644 RepID=UPI001E59D5FE|nr:TolC family protein [Mucilaginibacter sp. UR6-11]MCC8426627.1 TolC family protein [Mucilaginibacter sp. UR6-11]